MWARMFSGYDSRFVGVVLAVLAVYLLLRFLPRISAWLRRVLQNG